MNTEIIAEIGWNFMGDMDLAADMISKAAQAGADTVKFQYWQEINLKPGLWDTDGRREIYKNAQLDSKKIERLRELCGNAGVNFLISVFNKDDAGLMFKLGCNEIKIPSHEVANTELHEFVSTKFQKIYVSLGAGSWSELEQSAKIYEASDVTWYAMHCVSSYPCPVEAINLQKLDHFNWTAPVGLSDHTQSTLVPALAVMRGCSVIEKHFTSDKNLPGRDNKFALNFEEFSEMVNFVREAEKAKTDLGLEAQDREKDTINTYRGRWG